MNFDYSYGNSFYKYDLNNYEGLKCTKYNILAPPQEQKGVVGVESVMNPRPIFDNPAYLVRRVLSKNVEIETGS